MEQRILGNRYELVELVGSGGMADVYKAHDKLLDRTVAVKVLHAQFASDAEFVARFQREAQGAAKMSHPNIVNIYDVGQEGKCHYIVMEYVSGQTLREELDAGGRLPVSTALAIARQIAEALHHAHQNGLVHCDIKPHNILVMEDGRIKVADFGIARAVSSVTSTYTGNIVGSVHYFSPEQAKGASITPKSDVYSLGVVLYEMLTGELPFTGETPVGIALKHLQEEPLSVSALDPSIPPFVDALVSELMAKDPSQRPDSGTVVRQIAQDEAMLGGASAPTLDPYATQVLPRVREAEVDSSLLSRPGQADWQPAQMSPVEHEGGAKKAYRSKAFLFALFLVLFFGFFTGAFLSYGKFWSSAEVVVPDVTGQTLAVAKQKLEDKNLRVDIAEMYDSNVPTGQVVKQDPEGGSKVKEERLVTIYVSKGGEEVSMPELKGLQKSAAEDKITSVGLKLGVVTEEFSSQPAGKVIAQDPRAGTKISKGQVVDLVISKGERSRKVAVPSVVGGKEAAAKDAIENRGLHIGSVTKEASSQAAGTVVRQSPAAGSEVEEGTSVDLVLATEAEKKPSEKQGGTTGGGTAGGNAADKVPSRDADSGKTNR